ncbi:MAG: hypothetical protein ACFC03_00960 [Candidatus Malihini olakiniferum]
MCIYMPYVGAVLSFSIVGVIPNNLRESTNFPKAIKSLQMTSFFKNERMLAIEILSIIINIISVTLHHPNSFYQHLLW